MSELQQCSTCLTFIKVYHLHTSVGTTAKLHSLTFIKVYHLHTSVETTTKLPSSYKWNHSKAPQFMVSTFINVKVCHLHCSVGTTAKLHSLTFIKVYHLYKCRNYSKAPQFNIYKRYTIFIQVSELQQSSTV